MQRDPIYHLYLQAHPTNGKIPGMLLYFLSVFFALICYCFASLTAPQKASLAVLGPEATSERFDIPTTIRSVNTTMYLNVGTESTSYKSLTFGTTASTDSWGLEGDAIMTKPGSALGRSELQSVSFSFFSRAVSWRSARFTNRIANLCHADLNFVVCRLEGSFWRLWLQTGSDMPSGNSCSNYQTIHLPCLC